MHHTLLAGADTQAGLWTADPKVPRRAGRGCGRPPCGAPSQAPSPGALTAMTCPKPLRKVMSGGEREGGGSVRR
ncbi:hypothetical protein GCM10009535_15220 [Streptomyces thermocarboxydovorans]|uniref:Uncharacterized protein n=1 Tax=Streptomyces thermocarboxydovorans TaxID=59298 RepID=A0ABP3SHL1_9ACTN